ncbi:MAG: hypothetical protein KDI31_11110 [Pseudomonadales bacterium]|nr:hypothetical protein [Pseudomonadales bacterium]
MARTLVAKNSQRAPFVERRLSAFQEKETINDSRLRALLVVDGDEDVDPIPRYEDQLSLLRQDVIDGNIHPAHDLPALQVALSALLRGYRIFHEQYARRIDTNADDLDARITEVVRLWLKAMAQPPAVS